MISGCKMRLEAQQDEKCNTSPYKNQVSQVLGTIIPVGSETTSRQHPISTHSATKRRTQSPKRTAGSSPNVSAPLINLEFSCGTWFHGSTWPVVGWFTLKKCVLFYNFLRSTTTSQPWNTLRSQFRKMPESLSHPYFETHMPVCSCIIVRLPCYK